jgi:hypothetical protein
VQRPPFSFRVIEPKIILSVRSDDVIIEECGLSVAMMNGLLCRDVTGTVVCSGSHATQLRSQGTVIISLDYFPAHIKTYLYKHSCFSWPYILIFISSTFYMLPFLARNVFEVLSAGLSQQSFYSLLRSSVDYVAVQC